MSRDKDQLSSHFLDKPSAAAIEESASVSVTDSVACASTSNTLLTLSAAAGALLACQAQAAEPVNESRLAYQASHYREADIKDANHGGGAKQRYEIDTHQLSYVTPLSRKLDLALDYSYETMSGASPWYVMPDASGKAVQIMSGASISEERHDVKASLAAQLDTDTRVSAVLGVSDENDYRAHNMALELQQSWQQERFNLSLGIGYSDDDLEPTEGGSAIYSTRPRTAERDQLTAYAGLGVTLNRYTAIQTSLSVNDLQGYLSDPYKLAFIQSPANLVADQRPDDRRQWVLQTRLRHYVPAAKAALHIDYRYFDDDWDVSSHTAQWSWLQNLPANWRIDTGVRYYSQSAAYFYAPYYVNARPDGLASSDYRLSPYGAVSLKLKAVKTIGAWSLQAEWESYRADADLALDDVTVENPGLLEFDSFSLGLKLGF